MQELFFEKVRLDAGGPSDAPDPGGDSGLDESDRDAEGSAAT
jgi:hypothetical protein